MIAYVTAQGARVAREGRHLVVRKGEAIYNTLFTYKLDQLLLFGNIELTHSAILQLLHQDVDTVFLTQTGRYMGRLASPESKNVHLRKRQFALLDDPDFCLAAAKSIVSGKLYNMASLLLRVRRARVASLAGQRAGQIQDLQHKLAQVKDVAAVRGIEGRGSALYFEGFPHGFIEEQGFVKRVRRPPTDPVNSVLSLLYTFLMNRVYAAVRAAGLDPYPGVLHSLDYGRYSLVLDLMEEFRTIIADTLAFSLFNLKILQKHDFAIEELPPEPLDALMPQDPADHKAPLPDVSADPLGQIGLGLDPGAGFDLPEQRVEETPENASPATGKPPVKLTHAAFKRVIEAFERKLTTVFHHPLADRQLTYQEALFFQAGLFRKVVEGEVQTYQPLLLK
jgi:CRISPR-associated protein Cas1